MIRSGGTVSHEEQQNVQIAGILVGDSAANMRSEVF